MTHLTHLSAQEWIQSGKALDADAQARLGKHLASCAECRDYALFQAELAQGVLQIYPYTRHAERDIRQKAGAAGLALEKKHMANRIFHGIRVVVGLGVSLALLLVLVVLAPRLLPERGSGVAETPQKTLGSGIQPTQTPAVTASPTLFISPTPPSTGTPTVFLPNEQLLAQAILHSEEKAYCSWQILGQGTNAIYAWVLCEMQVAPFSAASVPAAISLDGQGHYQQVQIPRD